MYKIKIGCVCCIALFLLLAGCEKEEPVENVQGNNSEITKAPEQIETQEQTELTGMPGLSEGSEKMDEPASQVEMELVEYTYPFYELWCAGQAEDSYEVTDDGACRIIFSEKYSKMTFALLEGINMALCDHVTVKAKSEYGRFGVNLYDETVYIDPWDMHAYAEYDFGGEGVQDFTLWPELTCDVWGVGIISVDEVEDFSQYVIDVYSVTFHMKAEK
ncbi:MAG: hypothetical protein J6J38_01375 [Lachnospiraceae bacterium]|nr:hypothetical protein [Lachnospiraceae bacterium]